MANDQKPMQAKKFGQQPAAVVPKEEKKPEGISWLDAQKALADGKRVARIGWGNSLSIVNHTMKGAGPHEDQQVLWTGTSVFQLHAADKIAKDWKILD